MKKSICVLLMFLGIGRVYSQDYFPLVKGSYWIYNVYNNGVLSYSDSAVYNKSVELNDTAFYLLVHHYIENNSISTTDTFFLYKNFTDNNAIMLSNRNQPVIDSAVYAKHSYVDGDWWIPKRNVSPIDTMKISFVGNLTVTAGTFTNCFLQGREYYFAPNVGIVKIILWNQTSYYDLVRYHIGSASTINELSKQNLQIYPNPAHNYIRVSNMDMSQYTIVTNVGKVIEVGFINNSTIDVSGLKPGIYIINCTKDKKLYTANFIKN